LHGNDLARHRVHFDFRGSLATVALNFEIPHEPAPLVLECDTLYGAGHTLQRDRARRIFVDLRF